MIFKALRYLIYSPLDLIIDSDRICDVNTYSSDIDQYDYYEVIGIRAWVDPHFSGYGDGEKLIVSLKPTATSYFTVEGDITKAYNNYEENAHQCLDKKEI